MFSNNYCNAKKYLFSKKKKKIRLVKLSLISVTGRRFNLFVLYCNYYNGVLFLKAAVQNMSAQIITSARSNKNSQVLTIITTQFFAIITK